MKSVFLSFAVLCSLFSAAQSLNVGDPAPAIKASEWIKGEAVNQFETGKIYVVEFWATWCGPCKKSIPHITQLAKQYSNDVTIIGMSVLENDIANVKPFVDRMGDKMNYTVAIDEQQAPANGKGFMVENWLRPAGINGIPTAVIVGKTGLIEWIGNPMDLEPALKKVIDGQWDTQTFRKQQEQKDLVENMTKELGDNPDWTALRNELKDKYPYLSADSVLTLLQLNHFGAKRDIPAYTRTYTLFMDKFDPKTNASEVNGACWKIFSFSNEKQELNKAAGWMKDVVAKNSDNPYFIDTYANCLYKKGDKKKAIAAEQKAIAVTDEMLATELAITLYKMLNDQSTWKYPEVKPTFVDNEAAWKKVTKCFTTFSAWQADSIVAAAAIKYAKGIDDAGYVRAIMNFAEKVGDKRNGIQLNENAWEVFRFSNDPEQLKLALQWSEASMKDEKYATIKYAMLDTYANILYKLNRKDEAITTEQKALALCPEKEKPEYNKTLAKMQNGEKTW